MPVYVRRVTIDNILAIACGNGLFKRLTNECKTLYSQQIGYMGDLINYFRDIGPRKSLWFFTERDIERTMPVKPDHAVKSGPVKKQEIKWVMGLIKALSQRVVMRIALFKQCQPLPFKIGFDGYGCYLPVCYTLIKVDQVRI